MIFMCQSDAISQLEMLSKSNRQSILIEGPSGCGKSYLARQYACMVGVPDVQMVSPKVDEIRSSIETCINFSQPVVLYVENLDIGVPAASYALLKFLEEPIPNVYIIVTCRNLRGVPDTIISRSTVVSVSPPIDSDIRTYAMAKKSEAYSNVSSLPIWRCVRTFKDADLVLDMTDAQLRYFDSLSSLAKFNDSVSNMVWKLGHYDDNSEAPIELVIRYLMDASNSSYIQRCGIDCIRDLNQGRIAAHAVLSKFIFNVKYCE